jgi:hypothetical protein
MAIICLNLIALVIYSCYFSRPSNFCNVTTPILIANFNLLFHKAEAAKSQIALFSLALTEDMG